MESTNFGFLAGIDDDLAHLGADAESYFADPDVCIFKLRQFGEFLSR